MAITSTSTATVPEGKVWKVEASSQALYVDKPNVDYGIPISNQPFTTGTGNILWLSENSTISVSSGVGKVSILEFNLVDNSSGAGVGSGGLSSEGLEFNQVINYSDSQRFLSEYWRDFTPVQIPDGKVWKITSIKVGLAQTSSNPSVSPIIQRINSDVSVSIGNILCLLEIGRSNNGGFPVTSDLKNDIWLNSGEKIIKLTTSGGSGETNAKFYLSFTAIEYNIPQ